MSGKLFDSVVVEREGFAFSVTVKYEHKLSFCYHCKLLGHSIQHCNCINNIQHHAAPKNQQKKPIQQSNMPNKEALINTTQ